MQVKFNVFGNPRGKQRPRLCSVDGRNIVYTPKQTIEYEKLIKASYIASSKVFFERNIPIEINILAYFFHKSSIEFATKKPDADNIIKIVLDALNKVAFYDDAQVSKICRHFENNFALACPLNRQKLHNQRMLM